MTHAVLDRPGSSVTAPGFARLLTTELRRLFARRIVKALLAILLIGYLAALGTVYHQHHKIGPADRAAATADAKAIFGEQEKFYRDCAANSQQNQVDDNCGNQPDSYQDYYYLDVHPMSADVFDTTALVIGVGTAAIGFLIGTTFIGAEWSSRNLIAWLFWEPRRLRLLGAKLLAVLAAVLTVSAVLQVGWAVIGRVFMHYRGTGFAAGPARGGITAGTANLFQLRAALLVLIATAIGFGLAALARTSAGALGVGFLYFAVVETGVRALRPHLQPYLLTVDVAAWVRQHGQLLYYYDFDRVSGEDKQTVHRVTNTHGAIVLLVYAAVAVVPAAIAFRRRDIS